MNKLWLLIVFLMFCFLTPTIAAATPKGPSVETGNEEIGFVYHGNKKSFKFHAPDCRYYTCKNCTIILHSATEAEEKRFSPCGLCKPLYYAKRHEKEQSVETEKRHTTPTSAPKAVPAPAAIETKKSVSDGKG